MHILPAAPPAPQAGVTYSCISPGRFRAPGIAVGEYVEPAATLGPPGRITDPGFETDTTRVYVTSDVKQAECFAALYVGDGRQGDGWVYRVEPAGPLEDDPDFPVADPCVHFSTPRALVVEVVARAVLVSPWEMTRRQAPHFIWEEGSPMYDANGYALPSEQMLAAGIDTTALTGLGRWIPHELVLQIVAETVGQGRRLPAADEVQSFLHRCWTEQQAQWNPAARDEVPRTAVGAD